MDNQAVLEKAIRLAIDGGWNEEVTGLSLMAHTEGFYLTSGENEYAIEDLYPLIIFSHDFAKALWGEEHDCDAGYHKRRETMRVANRGGGYIEHEINLDYVTYCLHNTQNWQYHLQQMVIADDPIKYLGENL